METFAEIRAFWGQQRAFVARGALHRMPKAEQTKYALMLVDPLIRLTDDMIRLGADEIKKPDAA